MTWTLVRFAPRDEPGDVRLAALLPDGETLVDLQAAHVALKGRASPHLRSVASFRLAAAYARDLAEELVLYAARQASPPIVARASAVATVLL